MQAYKKTPNIHNFSRYTLCILFLMILLSSAPKIAHANASATGASPKKEDVSPHSVEPDVCLSIVITTQPVSVVPVTIPAAGIGQTYNVRMRVVNNCGETLTDGGTWSIATNLQCDPFPNTSGYFNNGRLPAIPAKGGQQVDYTTRLVFCIDYSNGKPIATSLPSQVITYGNASSSFRVGGQTVVAKAPPTSKNLY